jgi:type II secretory pathway pseudopilin PulG
MLEIMIVIAIIAAIGAGVGVAVFTQFKRAQVKIAKQRVKEVMQGVTTFMIDNNNCPKGMDDLVAQKYIARGAAKDPWGKDFTLKCPGTQDPDSADISSAGTRQSRTGRATTSGSGTDRKHRSDDEHGRHPPRRRSGFTLIEIMVVAESSRCCGGDQQGLRRSQGGPRARRRRTCRRRCATCSTARRRRERSTAGDRHGGRDTGRVSDDRFSPARGGVGAGCAARGQGGCEEEEDAPQSGRRAEAERQARRASSFDLSKLEGATFRPKRARFAAVQGPGAQAGAAKKAKCAASTPARQRPLTSGRLRTSSRSGRPSRDHHAVDPEGSVYSLVVTRSRRVRIYNQEASRRGAHRTTTRGTVVQ